LGSILIDPAAYEIASQIVAAPDFFIAKHVWLWEAFESLHDDHTPIDFLTVSDKLESAHHLGEIGGPAYLTALLGQTPSSLHAEHYARAVKEFSIRRAAVKLATELVGYAIDMSAPTECSISKVSAELERLAGENLSHKVETIAAYLPIVLDEIEERVKNPCEVWGLPTGYPRLDRETGGKHPGEVTLLVGAPGVGKTNFEMGCALELGKHAAGAFITLEMSPKALVYRWLSGAASVPGRNMKTGYIADDQYTLITHAIEALESLPIYLDGGCHDTDGLRAVLSNLKRKHHIQWFILDYLLLMEGDGKNEIEQTACISRDIKNICTELDLAGDIINSVNKEGFEAESSASMKNARGSGQLIHDADIAFFLMPYKDEPRGGSFYLEEDKKRMATLWCKKGRNLEDPAFHINLVRRPHSPLWAEMEERKQP
jgi:replicative DNA helicase